MHILAAPGVPTELRATSCRTFDTREAAPAMADWAEHYIQQRAQGLPAAEPATTPTDADEGGLDDVQQQIAELIADDLEADADVELGDLAMETAAALHPDDAADLAHVGVDDEIPVPDPPPGDEVIALQPKMPPAAARRAVYGYLLRLRDAGVWQLRVSDHVEEIATLTGMRVRWMYGVLGEFCEASDCGPALLRQIEDRGPYEILPAERS
jgi:hypothetical protein